MKGPYTFSKKERLCNRSAIGRLYASPHRVMVFPLSVHWTTQRDVAAPGKLEVVLVAPKKKLHHAVDRNRVKRLMRECYRMRKHRLAEALEQQQLSMALGINYVHQEILSHEQLSVRFEKLITILINELQASEDTDVGEAEEA
ncbi:MAG: ribonuclease P protein component [Bacteroidales bacterium]|nr:ribonuclease P protein component [Bacteroidales bacterium]